ncbi:hypothetical protein FKX85_01630 [Echinicola soli]|uniref:C-terminal domain of CHU protein family protein n=1 Tax=Echinicola soli TaxID=2591634 RepID=A0A514CDU0_9BACT|nr:gliding motility-associated C-terminal domain-containing protein [Echinicola soli]QDH77814.1 hypothetical protein FKX85_01630 [Echinicola soli]
MKRTPFDINLRFIYLFLPLLLCLATQIFVYGQGYNDNEWIFGYCGPNTENNYISFGKGDNPNVNTLPGSIVVGQDNNAIAIDPLTGEPLFYTNGELVYNYLNQPIQGAPNGINGDFEGTQTVAIAPLSYDPEGDRLFYTFYISPSGQLLYSVMDMNAQGAAPADSPPAGEVTTLDEPIGPASGAIAVVKTPSSPSYLISFESGELISREITETEGVFNQTDSSPITFAPEKIAFDENSGTLALIPENASDPIVLMDFDTSTGSFSNPRPLDQSTGDASENYGGTGLSPDGDYFYYSKDDQLLRIPTDTLDADPQVVPTTSPSGNNISQIHDIKVGPDGQLYYIYQEENDDAFYVGTVENPDNTVLEELTVDDNPFEGTDFCGDTFPTFAPNADIDVSVDFTYSPEMPCMNNPLQITSQLTPPNIPVESYEWELSPPPTDQDGEEIELDLTEEHLLLPADATSEQNINVTLTVTLADGSTQTSSQSITFQENNLQASFTPSDTTTCLTCIDLNEMLEVSSGEEGQGGSGGGGGGGIPGIPGGGGGGGGQDGGSDYEYFWSNKKEEGWIPEGANEVCDPGTYWVLAREQGSSCYVYAETTVKMWDPVANEKVDDQTNNIWYFGNNAGLDFNPDPDDPNAPSPRPVEVPDGHPGWTIPEGTTTISDQAGQVLFYTDGQTVWDLNGNPMQDGTNIGGDNTSAQSVIAVKVPQEQTLYYLFTTQTSGGNSTTKFSLVDIKGENQNGVGSVVSGDNFLFSPGTEQSAAIASGDTTWVMFHEMGNNTFRAYPTTSQGIGQVVTSDVGTTHSFGNSAGSMKFSPDGEKLAVTIIDGNGCSFVDVFDFDEESGELSEYATLDLGCDDEVYGLEFGGDSNKIFVSYQNGKGIEEYQIQAPSDDDDDNNCPSCFENAADQAALEQCIEDNVNLLANSSGTNFGAIQMGPNGQIYVAIPGATNIGTINPGSDCDNSTYSQQQAVSTEGGTSNLGLPAYAQNSGSNIPDPEIAGPESLCLQDGLALGEFEGGGEPDIDTYTWTILDMDGQEVFSTSGPGDEYQIMEYEFDSAGTYTVTLDVERCGNPDYYNGELTVEVIGPPPLTLTDDITLCSGSPVTLTAIDDYDPAEGLYIFEWTNAAGEILGNTNSIEVTEESIYTVSVVLANTDEEDPTFQACSASASVFVGPAFDFELTQDAETSCYEENYINFAPDTPVSGEWAYQLQGSTEAPTVLGEGYEWEVAVEALPAPGTYDIIFRAEDPILEGCTVEKRAELVVAPLPEVEVNVISPTSDCDDPSGSFEFTMLSDAETVKIVELNEEFPNVSEGETIGPFEDLAPGVYTITAENEGCTYTETVSIENTNPPDGLDDFSIVTTAERCTSDGILDGRISITFPVDGSITSANYVITREEDGEQFTGSTDNMPLAVPHGTYAIEISTPDGCAVTAPQTYEIQEKALVNFSVPSAPLACEIFFFEPENADDIDYTITGPDGMDISPQPNGLYPLGQEGVYQVRGEDPNGVDCPRVREMDLTLTGQVEYSLEGPFYDCETGLRYEAEIDPAFDEADYVYLWRTFPQGEIIGRERIFTPTREGTYTLDVQPRNGAGCPAPWIEFDVPVIVRNIPVELTLETGICSDSPEGTLSAGFDAPASANIEVAWFRTDQNGNFTIRMSEFDGESTISVTEADTYQVQLINSTNGQQCTVGSDEITVLSSDAEPPQLEESYTICAAEGITETLETEGNWQTYEWWREDQLISTDPTFTPTEKGNYTLIVTDAAACSFAVTFEVIEDCGLQVTTPDALIPGDPERNFVVYVNDFVDEISVLIYNRWGELIFHCIQQNIPENAPFCPWDGKVNDKKVPVGTYPVVIKLKSNAQGIEQTIKKAIVVIE